jgi:hypothetical protein
MPDQPGDPLDAYATVTNRTQREVLSSRGVQVSPTSAALHARLNIFRTFAAPRWAVNTSPVSCHLSPAKSRSSRWLSSSARSSSVAIPRKTEGTA